MCATIEAQRKEVDTTASHQCYLEQSPGLGVPKCQIASPKDPKTFALPFQETLVSQIKSPATFQTILPLASH
jgi:hypothetical protein